MIFTPSKIFNENLIFKVKKYCICLILWSLSITANAQPQRIDPPNWWTGMPDDTLQLLVEGKNVRDWNLALSVPGIRVLQKDALSNPDFAIFYLKIEANCKPGNVPLHFTNGKKKVILNYSILERTSKPAGLSPADLIYLIMPDRFANGNPSIDSIKGMHEGLNRSAPYGRHGGDLQGILRNLDYLKNLGASALWLTPVFENNQPKESYHGYAITDHYRVDPRLGDTAVYRKLINSLHERNMKIVLDVVFNHIGDRHRFYEKMAESTWFHHHDSFVRSNFRAGVLMDPNASETDRKQFGEGWFDTHMPDLNQKNPHLAKYLIQNSIWWVEYFGIDAVRIDTYAYPDQQFMADWNAAMKRAFPGLFIFGEIWDHAPGIQAWFTGGNGLNPSFDSGLDHVTDFEFYHRINKALHETFGWTEGVSRLYYHFSQDFLYKNASEHITFLDNHDLDRFWGTLNGNFEKWKSGMILFMTVRGIPCLFYGSEILMAEKGSHGKIREDFPGGWAGDKQNAFEKSSRSPQQQEAFEFIKNLAEWRKDADAIAHGKFTQFVPQDGLYVYFRHSEKQRVMMVYNGNEKDKTLTLGRFKEFTGTSALYYDPVSGERHEVPVSLALKPWQAKVLVFE